MKRIAIYIRVSTLEQAQEGYSIEEQKDRLIAYCKAHDWAIADIYVDGGYSGSNLKRPGIQKLMSEINNFDVVLVYKLDRLSRSQRDTLYLIEEVFLPNRVDFVSMQESFDTSSPFGKAMIGLLAVFAQLEREQIKERTFMGRVARAKKGLHQGGGKIPIGYTYNDGTLIVDPYEAEQVRKIFELYLSGKSLADISRFMKQAGYASKYGKYENWATVRNILRNPTYTGQIHFGEIIIDDAFEAIIDKEQFQTVQKLMVDRARPEGVTPFKSSHLLTGIMFCGYCGSRYYARNSGKYGSYACYSRTKQISSMVKDPNCKNRYWKFSELEPIVEMRVRELLMSPTMAREIAMSRINEKPVANNNNAKIEKRIHEIKKQIDKLMELYQIDGIPADILGANINKLYNEKTSLESMLTVETESETISFDLLEKMLHDAAQIWDFADVEQKRRIIRTAVKRIILTGDNVDIEWNF